MKKKVFCYTCQYYGMCNVHNESCSDHTDVNILTLPAIFNIAEFNTKWLRLHDKWWRRFDREVMNIRKVRLTEFLSGRKPEVVLEEMEKQMKDAVEEEVINGGQPERSAISESTERS